MNKAKMNQQIFLELKSVTYFVFGIGILFLWITGNTALELFFLKIDLSFKIFVSLMLTSLITGLAFYYCLHIDIAIERFVNILDIESDLIGHIYQQFDDIDLTVFNQKHFSSEDEVLNFILTEIPELFINCEAEFLYESIRDGYLTKINQSYYISNNSKRRGLKVFYICDNAECELPEKPL